MSRPRSLFSFTRNGNLFKGKGISVIIPVGGKERIKLVSRMLDNIWAQNYGPYEIVLVEYGLNGSQHFKRQFRHPVKYVYMKGGAVFNKSAAMNRGFMAAKHDICVLLDADILIPDGYFKTIDKSMSVNIEACFLLRRILHTKRDPSVFQNHKNPPIHYIRDDNFNGASFAISKDAYKKIGGMCEEFVGYGYEDLEFWDRLRKILKLHESRIYDAIHMNHSHVKGYDLQWKKNQGVWNRLHGEDPKNRAKRFRAKYLDRYGN